jgi:cation diffusion facilitator CzcD-associated flavoprotein CzcO
MNLIDVDVDVRRSLAYLGPAPANWVPKTAGIDHDVVIVGGGQTGTALAFALRRAGIGNITVIDGAAEGNEGVWRHRARMETLRTPKSHLGPELRVPSLTFQAWYEARKGADAYAKIGRIARGDWADYLIWFRDITDARVRFGTRLLLVEPEGDHFRLHLEIDGETRIETARKIVLATGFRGAGGPNIPEVVAHLPTSLHDHTDNLIDFTAFKGKRIGVLGAAASAFDAASTAIESGATESHLFCRRPDLPHRSRVKATGFPGFDNLYLLPDADRWNVVRRIRELGGSVPPDSVARAVKYPNFHFHPGAPWEAVRVEGGKAVVTARGRDFAFDYLVSGTGFKVDISALPEFAPFADRIAAWGDVYTPPEHDRDEQLSRFPYLGPGYELHEKEAGSAGYLRNIHVLNFAGFLSSGRILGDIASLVGAVPRLTAAISRDFFLADREHHIAAVTAVPTPDFTGAEYANAVWKETRTEER